MNKNKEFSYLFDLKSKEMMHLYYASKNKHGHIMEDRDVFIKNIVIQIKDFVNEYDFIVYPQSSNDFVESIVLALNKESIIVYKNSIKDILTKIDDLNLQKSEKSSHLERILNMDGAFKINSLKATQRRKYESLLFKKTKVMEGKGIIIDDSCFSGTTFNAIKLATGVNDCLAIFAK